jgi:sulfur-oxidizing protein SoxY
MIKLKAPDIAENGAVIPITASTKKASKIAIFQSANPESAVAVFDIPANGIPDYSIRIKMQKTGIVTAVAEIDGKLYAASKTVKVTIGGCGG